MGELHFFPVRASQNAAGTDAIFLSLLALFAVIILAVVILIVTFSIRYRRGTVIPRKPISRFIAREFEISWTLLTLLSFVAIFVWAAAQNFIALGGPSKNALTLRVVAKQWMWKIEHPGGQREINTLHIPLGRPVRLVMSSQDVIHSFFVPAFRAKKDIVPGLVEELWFVPTKAGEYDLFCAEFCGTDHSAMRGKVYVMNEQDYSSWLSAQPQGNELTKRGAALFRELGCSGCHVRSENPAVRAPSLNGVFGGPVALSDGRVVTADEAYIRDSILEPLKDVVAGYEPIMPSFSGRVSEGDLTELIGYIRALGRKSKP